MHTITPLLLLFPSLPLQIPVHHHHQPNVSSCNICVVVVSGASLNTDIGPDSEAQIAPHHDDYDGKDYDHEGHEESDHHTDINEKSEKLATNGNNGQKNGVEKTNTPV